jgi:hypothetical protein
MRGRAALVGPPLDAPENLPNGVGVKRLSGRWRMK